MQVSITQVQSSGFSAAYQQELQHRLAELEGERSAILLQNSRPAQPLVPLDGAPLNVSSHAHGQEDSDFMTTPQIADVAAESHAWPTFEELLADLAGTPAA